MLFKIQTNVGRSSSRGYVKKILIIFSLHYLVLWTTATLWYCPVDVFLRHFDTATFAVNAILYFDRQIDRGEEKING